MVESGSTQARDLSLPGSRIVTNPHNGFDRRSTTTQTTGADHPLSAGYYVDRRAPQISDLLTVNERPQGTPSSLKRPVAGFVDSFSGTTGWVFGGSNTFTVAAGVATLNRNTTTGAYANAAKDVTVDLDAHPMLRISVRSAAQNWGLKVNGGSGSDIVLQPTTSTVGVLDYDVRAVSGWSGSRTFSVRLFSSGYQKPAVFDELQFHSAASTSPATGFVDAFDGTLSPAWTVSSAGAASTTGGQLDLTVPGTSGTTYGYVTRTVTTNLDRYPYLEITTTSVAQTWALKVTQPGQPTVVAQTATAGIGTFTYNLTGLTGLHGVQTLSLQILVNGYQKPARFGRIQLAAPNGPREAVNDAFTGTTVDPGWATSGASATASSGLLTLTNTSAGLYGRLSRTVTVDVDSFRRLKLVVRTAANSWALSPDPPIGDGVRRAVNVQMPFVR